MKCNTAGKKKKKIKDVDSNTFGTGATVDTCSTHDPALCSLQRHQLERSYFAIPIAGWNCYI